MASSNFNYEKGDSEETDINRIRELKREIQKEFRQQKKDSVLNEHRENLVEVHDPLTFVSVEQIKELGLKFTTSKPDSEILHQIRNMVHGESQIETFLKVHNTLNKLVGILSGNKAQDQLDAVTCITNFATGSHKSVDRVAKATGAYLVTFMQGDSHFLQNQCAWAAGNIANDCKQCFQVLNAQGLLPALEHLLESPYPEVVQSAAFALNACSKYDCLEMKDLTKETLSKLLLKILNRKDLPHRALVDIMFTLSNISLYIVEVLSDTEQQLIAAAVLQYFQIATMQDTLDVELATPVTRCLGNLSTGTGNLCDFIINNENFQNGTRTVMASDYYYLRREMLWVLNNLLGVAPSFNNPDNWFWLLIHLKPFLSPLDESAIQVLLLLCNLRVTKGEFLQKFNESGLVQMVMTLCSCGKPDVEMAAKTFCSICEIVK